MRSSRLLAGLLALCLMCAAAPATSDTRKVADPKHDNGRAGDITRVEITNGKKRVKVKVKLRGLTASTGVQVAFKYHTDKNHPSAYLASLAQPNSPSRAFQRNRPTISPAYYVAEPCGSFRARFVKDKKLAVLSWSHRCESKKGNTRKLYVVVNAYYTTPGQIGGVEYHDDFTRGLRVKRG